MDRDQLAQFLQAGASGQNPFVQRKTEMLLADQKAQNDRAMQELLYGKQTPEQTQTIPGKDVELPGPTQNGQLLMGHTPDQTVTTPAQYKPGLTQLGADYDQQRNARVAQQLHDDNGGAAGGTVNVSDKGVSIGTKEFNPYQHGPQQAKDFDKQVMSAYKPINEQLNASKATIDYLNQGNSASDKMALINEARLAAGQGGSRAISHLVDVLSGGQTSAGSFQDKLNWLQNTPNIPTMQPAQRDALREVVYGRLGDLDRQHQQAQSSLAARGAVVAPYTDYNALIKAQATPADTNLSQLKSMAADYQKQRQGSKNQVSQPSTASDNPTTLDKLKSFLGMGGTQQPAQQSTSQAPMSFEEFKAAKKAGKL